MGMFSLLLVREEGHGDDPHENGVSFNSLICFGDLVCIGSLDAWGYILTGCSKGEEHPGICS